MPHPIEIIIPIVAALATIGVGLYYLLSGNEPQTEYTRSKQSEFVDDTDKCTICLEHIQYTHANYLNCGHCFHAVCINRWRQRADTCPNCIRKI